MLDDFNLVIEDLSPSVKYIGVVKFCKPIGGQKSGPRGKRKKKTKQKKKRRRQKSGPPLEDIKIKFNQISVLDKFSDKISRKPIKLLYQLT